MTLDELKEEAKKYLPITDQEHLDQEGYKNHNVVFTGISEVPILMLISSKSVHCLYTSHHNLRSQTRYFQCTSY